MNYNTVWINVSLSLDLKTIMFVAFRMSMSKLFHFLGPWDQKAELWTKLIRDSDVFKLPEEVNLRVLVSSVVSSTNVRQTRME